MRKWMLFWMGAGLAVNVTAASPQLLNGIVAIVNGTVITENEAREYIEPAIDFLRRTSKPAEFQEKALTTYRDGLNQLIDRQLILHDFKTAGYSIPDRVIEDFVQERIREQYGDRAKLIETLQARGITYAKFREEIRDTFIVEQMLSRNVSSAVLISPFKIEKFYEDNQKEFRLPDQIKLRMIVLNKPAGTDPAAVRALGTELLRKLRAGADFGEMAAVYSEGSQRAQNGDWGWTKKDVLRKELAAAAEKLGPGQISELIDTPDAAYLMKVEEMKIAHVRPLAEVRDEIEKTLIGQERQRLQKAYVERLRKNAFIRFF